MKYGPRKEEKKKTMGNKRGTFVKAGGDESIKFRSTCIFLQVLAVPPHANGVLIQPALFLCCKYLEP